MVDLTDRVALRKPEGSDPFLRSDFEYNWDRLDDYPGYFPCTAASHPTWGADQAGLLILETDTGKIFRWTGAAFVTPNVFPKALVFTATPNVTVAGSGTFTQAMGNFSPPRLCNVLILGTAAVEPVVVSSYQFMNGTVKIDTVGVSINDGVLAASASASIYTAQAPVIGYAANVSAASHALSFTVVTGVGATTMRIRNIALTVIYLD